MKIAANILANKLAESMLAGKDSTRKLNSKANTGAVSSSICGMKKADLLKISSAVPTITTLAIASDTP